MQSHRFLVAVLVPACVLVLAAAKNGMQDAQTLATEHSLRTDSALLDSYIQLLNPGLALSATPSGREGRTTLTVKLSSDSSVSRFTPVVSPQVDGITVDVLNTWEALKNIAAAYRSADIVNQQSPGSQLMFPRTSSAARAASIVPPTELMSSPTSPRPPPLNAFPPNLLMVPFGSTVAAYADVMDVSYDDKTAAITLQLDVVHDPVAFSQFVPHKPCSVCTAEAHYHIATRPGMSVDGPGLLQALKTSDYMTEGLHIFLKSEPLSTAFAAALTPTSAQLTVGQIRRVNIAVTQLAGGFPAPNGVALTIVWSGPGQVTATSPDSMPPRQAPGHRQAQNRTAYTDSNGKAYFDMLATGPGVITADVRDEFKGSTLLASIDIMVVDNVPPVFKLLLLPAKAYRRCGDPATLTVVALNSAGGPVPGANVSIALFGDCTPDYAATVLTGADGKAEVTVRSNDAGAAAVVAATQGPGGIVISSPSHIIFFQDHGYLDKREQEYYGGHEGGAGDYWRGRKPPHPEGRPHDRDAWHYEAEAAKLATQRAA